MTALAPLSDGGRLSYLRRAVGGHDVVDEVQADDRHDTLDAGDRPDHVLDLLDQVGGAVERHEERKRSIVLEANALGTAFLRADVLDEPNRGQLKRVIYEYAKTRALKLPRPEPGESHDDMRYRLLEESIEELNGPLLIEHYETAFVKLNFDQ